MAAKYGALCMLLKFVLCVLLTVPRMLSAETARKVKIGFLTDLTASAAYAGISSQVGAKLAAKEMSEENWPVEVVFGDHQLKTATAVSEAQKMLTLANVDALYVEFSAPAVAVAPIAAAHKKLFVGSTAAESFLTHSSYAFKTFLDYRKGCREIAAYWKRMGYRKIGMLKPETEFGEICLSGARGVLPELVVEAFQVGENVSGRVLKLKKSGAEAVFNVGYEADVLNTYRAMAQLRWRVPLGVCRQDGLTQQIIDSYRDLLEGATAFGLTRVSPALAEKLKAYDPHAATRTEMAALAYLHVRQLVSAVRSCRQDDPGCQAAALARSPAEALLGFVRFENRIAAFDSDIEVWNGGSLSLYRSYH